MAVKNGRDDHHDPKVTSLDAARKAAAQRTRTEKRAEAGSLKERLIGGVLIALALGAILHFGRKLLVVGSADFPHASILLAGG